MINQDIIRQKLQEVLAESKKKNPAYSLRALARKLAVPSSNLSNFLNGKRSFSSTTIEKIIYTITENPEERKDFLAGLNKAILRELKISHAHFADTKTLSEDEFIHLDNWHYYAIRSLFTLKDFRLDLFWIAKRLGITIDEANEGLEKLLKMGLIKIGEDDELIQTNKHLRTPDTSFQKDEVGQTLRKIHSQCMDQAKAGIWALPPSERDITWVNIPANHQKLDKAREIIRQFQDDMIALLEDGQEDEIYRLTVQLLPLTKPV